MKFRKAGNMQEINEIIERIIEGKITAEEALRIIEERSKNSLACKKFCELIEKLAEEENSTKEHVLELYARLYKTNIISKG